MHFAAHMQRVLSLALPMLWHFIWVHCVMLFIGADAAILGCVQSRMPEGALEGWPPPRVPTCKAVMECGDHQD